MCEVDEVNKPERDRKPARHHKQQHAVGDTVEQDGEHRAGSQGSFPLPVYGEGGGRRMAPRRGAGGGGAAPPTPRARPLTPEMPFRSTPSPGSLRDPTSPRRRGEVN